MKNLLRIILLMSTLMMLTACGKYYAVTVDAMNDGTPRIPGPIVISPGVPEVTPDDLWFRELAGTIAPSLASRGYRVTEKLEEADYAAFVTDSMDPPDVRTETIMMPRSYPVHRGYGRHHRVDYVTYYEPVATTSVSYSYNLNIDAYALTAKKERGPQVWKLKLRCTGATSDQRTLLYSIVQVLPKVLGTHSHGLAVYQVHLGNKGEVEVKPLN